MKNIRTKQFQILSDNQIAWDLLVQNYEDNGVEAPFFEYALTSTWLDRHYYLNRFWFDGDEAVGFVFYEEPCTDIHFSLRRGYEELADEMIAYADASMPGTAEEKTFFFHPGQEALMEAARKKGYQQQFTNESYIIDFDVANEQGEYVCFSGMWWVPENKLAYMEPLCTIPEYRHRGLAAAALSEHYRRTKELGATCMTGFQSILREIRDGVDIAEYELRYLPLFYKDLEQKVLYIANDLKNPQVTNNLLDDVEAAIKERLPIMRYLA